MIKLTANEVINLQDTFGPLIEFAVWRLAKKVPGGTADEFALTLTEMAGLAARVYKEQNGNVDLNLKFTTYMKEIIWRMQKRLSKAVREPLPCTAAEWMLAHDDIKVARDIERRFEAKGLTKPDFGYREEKTNVPVCHVPSVR